jgi:hypothetical protein
MAFFLALCLSHLTTPIKPYLSVRRHAIGAANHHPSRYIERMLRIYFLQRWFNLSDPAVEEALYDSRRCGGLSASTLAASQCG